MSITRARIIKAAVAPGETHLSTSTRGAFTSAESTRVTSAGERLARRIPALVVDAKEEAACVVAEARAKADALLAEARASMATVVENAAREAREVEIARVSAELLVRRATEEEEAEKSMDRTIELAALLAERLVGEAIAVEPVRVTALAHDALREARGARQIRIEACADDVPALEALLASVADGSKAPVARVEVSPELGRGSLVVHTDLGRVDARLAPQLARLGEALRTALRTAARRPRAGGPADHE